MSALIELPDVLIISILLDWLSLKSTTRLDSALCNLDTRPAFLSLLKNKCVSTPVPFSGIALIKWLLCRSICALNIEIYCLGITKREQEIYSRWFQLSGCALHSVKLFKPSSAELALIQRCRNLTCLWITHTELNIGFYFALKNNENLAELHLLGCTIASPTAIMFEMSNPAICSALKRLKLTNNKLDVIGIAKHCPNILSLEVSICQPMDANIYSSLGTLCPNVVNLCAHQVRGTHVDAFMRMLQSFRDLQSLHLSFRCCENGQVWEALAAHHATSLHTLSLCIDDGSFGTLPKIRDFFKGCDRLHTLFVDCESEFALTFVLAHFQENKLNTVTSLYLTCRASNDACYLLKAIALSCPKLTTLGVAFASGEGSQLAHEITLISTVCNDLHTLYIHESPTILDTDLRTLFPTCLIIEGPFPIFDVLC